MYKFTPGHHYSMQSYGIDPDLLSRAKISPDLFRADRKRGFTPPPPPPEPEPTFFEKIPPWVKISGLVAGVSGLTYAGWKATQ